MTRHLLTILVISLFTTLSTAQQTVRERADNFYKLGEDALIKKNYRQASRHFEKAVKTDTSFIAAYRLLGTSYELMNDYQNAVRYYQETLKRDSMFSRALYYQLADALYKTKRYSEAMDYFQQYYALQSFGPDRFGFNGIAEEEMEQRFRKNLDGNLKAVQVAMDSIKFMQVEKIVNLGSGVNSPDEEVFPALTTNREYLYYTRFKEGANSNDDLLISTYSDKNERWGEGRSMQKFNTRHPEGYSSLMRDSRSMYLTVCGREGVAGSCDIWQAVVKGDKIDRIQPIEGLVNSDYWDGQASVSCDGQQLFFASQRPGGMGGSDIWVSERMENGYWGRPVNLGNKINTDGHEQAPYITDDGRTLYFASSGHPGMGGEDIYMSWKDHNTGRWSVPINLGPPINTGFRETGFFLSANGKSGYFSSDRTGGLGGLDVYRFELTEKLSSDTMTFVEGFVLDSIMMTPIAGATVQLGKRPPVVSDEDGRFFICAYANEWIDMAVMDQENYHPYKAHTLIPTWENDSYYDIDLRLKPKRDLARKSPLPLPPTDTSEMEKKKVEKVFEHSVFFGFDNFDLTSDELNKLGDFIMQFTGKEIVKSEVFGYADNIGTDIYNLRLSEERAKGVAMYLVKNGITIDQIYMEGKGELDNENPKSRNRRVEIRVVIFE
jgi:outer membrane protein OmpA-like peptidoglycan-associated protein